LHFLRKTINSGVTEHGEHMRHKVLVGVEMPIVGLLCTIGIAKPLNCDPEIEKDQGKLSAGKDKCVAVVHSGMTFPARRVQIDAFNTLHHPLRYLVTNVEVMAEGVSLVGAD
jgi:hypothetical protein